MQLLNFSATTKFHIVFLILLSSLLFANTGFSKSIHEDFDNGVVNDWSAYGGNWGLSEGAVIIPNGQGYKAVNSMTFTDFIYEARLKVNSGSGNVGVIFRVSNPAVGVDSFKGYYAYIEPSNNLVGLGKMNDNWTFITSISNPINYETWYDLKVAASGDNIKIYLNNELKIEVNDSEPASGSVGIRSWVTDAMLDSLTVTTPVVGIYSLSGTDYVGEYTGTAELRNNNDGSYQLIKLVDYYSTSTYKSFNVSSALEGNATLNEDGTISMWFDLDRVGFIKEADGLVRDSDFHNNMPLPVTETLTPLGDEEYDGVYSATYNSITYRFYETWQRRADNGDQPIWRNLRQDIPTTDNPHSDALDAILSVSEYDESYYNALPEVAPYIDRDEFKNKIHFWVFDPTDFEYYQQPENQQRLRVIQKIIDPISLEETLLRNRAYRWKLYEKEAFLSEAVQTMQINELGMVSRWNETENRYVHDGDALLWTGIYVAAMAKKYLLTKDPTALEYLLKSLNGIVNTIEIVRDNPDDNLGETFARTIMTDSGRSDYDPEWRRGTMKYALITNVEYKRGGNNDMARGIFIGMLWGYKALQTLASSEYDTVMSKYGDLKIRMINALVDLRDQHGSLFLNKCRPLQVWDATKWPNTLQMNLVLYNIIKDFPQYKPILDWNDDIKVCYESINKYSQVSDLTFMNIGGIVSDWSGNHLSIWGLYNNYQGFIDGAGNNSEEVLHYKGIFTDIDEKMLSHRMGLFKLMSGTLRNQPNHPYWIDQAIWRLREIPTQREQFLIDWMINPKFTVSPYPELLWKYKKSDSAERLQSLRAYPLFESTTSSYYWKDNPFNKFRIWGYSGQSGIDFLIAYWFGRYYEVISADM